MSRLASSADPGDRWTWGQVRVLPPPSYVIWEVANTAKTVPHLLNGSESSLSHWTEVLVLSDPCRSNLPGVSDTAH